MVRDVLELAQFYPFHSLIPKNKSSVRLKNADALRRVALKMWRMHYLRSDSDDVELKFMNYFLCWKTAEFLIFISDVP